MKTQKHKNSAIRLLFYLFWQKNIYELLKNFTFLKLKRAFKDWIEHINKYHSLPVELRIFFLKKQIQEYTLTQKKQINYFSKFLKNYLEDEELSPKTQPIFFSFPEEIIEEHSEFSLMRSIDTLKMSLHSSHGLFTEYFQELEKNRFTLPLKFFHFEELSYHWGREHRTFKIKESLAEIMLDKNSLTDYVNRRRLTRRTIDNKVVMDIVNIKSEEDYQLDYFFNNDSIKFMIHNNYDKQERHSNKNHNKSWGFEVWCHFFFWCFSKNIITRLDLPWIISFKEEKIADNFVKEILIAILKKKPPEISDSYLTVNVNQDKGWGDFKLPDGAKKVKSQNTESTYCWNKSYYVIIGSKNKKPYWQTYLSHTFDLKRADPKELAKRFQTFLYVSSFYLTFKPVWGNSTFSDDPNIYRGGNSVCWYIYNKFEQSKEDRRYISSSKSKHPNLEYKHNVFKLELRLGQSNLLEFHKDGNSELDFNTWATKLAKNISPGVWKTVEDYLFSTYKTTND